MKYHVWNFFKLNVRLRFPCFRKKATKHYFLSSSFMFQTLHWKLITPAISGIVASSIWNDQRKEGRDRRQHNNQASDTRYFLLLPPSRRHAARREGQIGCCDPARVIDLALSWSLFKLRRAECHVPVWYWPPLNRIDFQKQKQAKDRFEEILMVFIPYS